MAFVLGLGAEAIGSIAAFAGEGVASATGSEALGLFVTNNVRGAAIGAVTGAATNGVQNAIGQENVSQIKSAAGVINSYNNGTFNFDMVKHNKGPIKKPKMNNGPLPVNNQKTTINNQQPVNNQPQVPQFNNVENFTEGTIFGTLDDQQQKLQKVLGFVLNTSSPEEIQADLQLKAQDMGAQLGTLIGSTTTDILSKNKDPMQAFNDTLTSYPFLQGITSKVLDYQKNLQDILPTTDRFKQIYTLFKGRSLSLEKSVSMQIDPQTGLKIFTFIDEWGQKFTYKENPNSIKIPPINGVWTGINSPNNALPVNLLDLFALGHDISYHERMFDLDADYRLISRCAQNLDRMGTIERMKALITIKYFSTIGHTIALYRGNPNTSFFQDQIANSPGEFQGAQNTMELQSYFDKGLETAVMNQLITNSPIGNPDIMKAEILKMIIDDMEIEVI
jgi:hypothetical protein